MQHSLSLPEAQKIVCAAFEGKRRDDTVLEEALKLCNIPRTTFVELKGEMRRTSVGRDRLCVLTPTGGMGRLR